MSFWAKVMAQVVVLGSLSVVIIPAQANVPGDAMPSFPTLDHPAGAARDLPHLTASPESTVNMPVTTNEHSGAPTNSEDATTPTSIHPAATPHLPPFITAPGEGDILMSIMIAFLGVIFLAVLVFYFRLHALPEHIAHRAGAAQYQVVAVLGLLSLFTHNHIYWIIGLLLAMVRLPDFVTPLEGMAASLATIADGAQRTHASEPVAPRQRAAIQPAAKDLSHA